MDSNPIQEPQLPQQVTPVEKPLIFWFVGGVLVIILVVGALYWYLSQQQKATPSPSPQPAALDTIEEGLNALSLNDLEQEFSSVDSDLQGL